MYLLLLFASHLIWDGESVSLPKLPTCTWSKICVTHKILPFPQPFVQPGGWQRTNQKNYCCVYPSCLCLDFCPLPAPSPNPHTPLQTRCARCTKYCSTDIDAKSNMLFVINNFDPLFLSVYIQHFFFIQTHSKNYLTYTYL